MSRWSARASRAPRTTLLCWPSSPRLRPVIALSSPQLSDIAMSEETISEIAMSEGHEFSLSEKNKPLSSSFVRRISSKRCSCASDIAISDRVLSDFAMSERANDHDGGPFGFRKQPCRSLVGRDIQKSRPGCYMSTLTGGFVGGPSRIRTCNPGIMSPLR